ncbi:mitochondrial 37S ribosomal protein bS21m [Limtongia smithiae]|uniref:mitochondrial 37S ribosomal protein bS21m n=1 Tax=Limtongia smithiae TaxID=1125753 RepID=UPI0034CDF1F5
MAAPTLLRPQSLRGLVVFLPARVTWRQPTWSVLGLRQASSTAEPPSEDKKSFSVAGLFAQKAEPKLKPARPNSEESPNQGRISQIINAPRPELEASREVVNFVSLAHLPDVGVYTGRTVKVSQTSRAANPLMVSFRQLNGLCAANALQQTGIRYREYEKPTRKRKRLARERSAARFRSNLKEMFGLLNRYRNMGY